MKNIFITWHYTTHGVAYLKHILSEFYLLGEIPVDISEEKLEQEKLNGVFDNLNQKGFLFDKIIYLTAPQSTFDNLSSRRFSYKKTILEDELVKENGLIDIYKEIIESNELCYNLELELDFVKNKYPQKYEDFKQSIWRNIQHYSLNEQVKWLHDYSNFNNVYLDKLELVELNITDLRDETQIAKEVNKWISKYYLNLNKSHQIINVSLGSNETQVVWHILAESGQLPSNTRFIKTYDDKGDNPEKRFKRFSIKEIPINLISTIGDGFKIYKNTKSPSRDLVNKKMEAFLKTGFSILLIGERGIGKSQIAKMGKDPKNDNVHPFREANCASFDEDSKAEAELFGYEKGAFTGANNNKKGLLEEANNGILFLDEIHHLSKLVQAKLMKSLQTNSKNKMSIRHLGSNKEFEIECRLIFATNKSIPELRENLLPDFYDRIVQHVVHIPSLRDTPEDRTEDWNKVWEDLNFKDKPPVPYEDELISWLKNLQLYGNYRDLQKIAMYYNVYNSYDEDTKKMITEKSAYMYARAEFEKYHSIIQEEQNEKFKFSTKKTTKEMLAEYKYELQKWAVCKFNGRQKAINHFKELGDSVCEKTFNDWKNKRELDND